MEKTFIQRARLAAHTFFSLYPPNLYFSLFLSSILFPLDIHETEKERQREKNREREKRERQKEANSGQSVIFISKSFAPFIRNPKRTLQLSLLLFLSLSLSLALSHFQILFLFTFAAAKVGSYSRPILSSPRNFSLLPRHNKLKAEKCRATISGKAFVLDEFCILLLIRYDIASWLKV